MTSKEVVYKMLRPRRWVTGAELERAAGSGALRRLRELRSDYTIKKQRIAGTNAYQYRLTGRR